MLLFVAELNILKYASKCTLQMETTLEVFAKVEATDEFELGKWLWGFKSYSTK
jgi:hypothetical protein